MRLKAHHHFSSKRAARRAPSGAKLLRRARGVPKDPPPKSLRVDDALDFAARHGILCKPQ